MAAEIKLRRFLEKEKMPRLTKRIKAKLLVSKPVSGSGKLNAV